MPLGNYSSLILLGAIWGASFLLIKIGVAEIGPITFAMLRVAIGALVLGIILAIRGERLPRETKLWRHLIIMGALGVMLPFAAITWGTQHIASSLSAILNATMPIFTFIIVALSGCEQTTFRRLAGVVLGFAGIVMLVLPQLFAGGLRVSLLGQLAVILASLSYAMAAVYANRHLTQQRPLQVAFGQLFLAALMLMPLALVEDSWRAVVTFQSVRALLILGIIGTALAYLIYYRLIREAGATFTSLVTYIVPLFGVVWGRIILDERLSWNAFAALGLILVGLLLVRGKPSKPQVGDPQSKAEKVPAQPLC